MASEVMIKFASEALANISGCTSKIRCKLERVEMDDDDFAKVFNLIVEAETGMIEVAKKLNVSEGFADSIEF